MELEEPTTIPQNIKFYKFSRRKRAAEKRGIYWGITQKQVSDLIESQNFKCHYAGIAISFHNDTASIDRVDSQKGYTIDNIVIVHKHINRMKSDIDECSFMLFCVLVSENIRSR